MSAHLVDLAMTRKLRRLALGGTLFIQLSARDVVVSWDDPIGPAGERREDSAATCDETFTLMIYLSPHPIPLVIWICMEPLCAVLVHESTSGAMGSRRKRLIHFSYFTEPRHRSLAPNFCVYEFWMRR